MDDDELLAAVEEAERTYVPPLYGSPLPLEALQEIEMIEAGSSKHKLQLQHWGVPDTVCQAYAAAGVSGLHQWQVECLEQEGVLDGRSLVYRAPTSSGKSLVADLLMLRQVLLEGKRALLIVPFVSLVMEKERFLEKVFNDTIGITVEGSYANSTSSHGYDDEEANVSVCTIEKANAYVNKAIEEGTVGGIGIVVVDEIHMLAEGERGALLEQLITKLRLVAGSGLQIVGLSATLPNLEVIAGWLDACAYQTDFRPVKLTEYVVIGDQVYDRALETVVRTLPENRTSDIDLMAALSLEVLQDGHSALVFCGSKHYAEQTCASLAARLRSTPYALEQSLSVQQRRTTLIQRLQACPAGLDPTLEHSIGVGVAYHHAGLTVEEREAIESGFREGSVQLLSATSTLAAGVNLPVRRVLFHPKYQRSAFLTPITYQQMAGRAGRKGIAAIGESFLLFSKQDNVRAFRRARQLIGLEEAPSIQAETGGLSHALLDALVSGVVQTTTDIAAYLHRSLLFHLTDWETVRSGSKTALAFLETNDFMKVHIVKKEQRFEATMLGKATIASSLSLNDGVLCYLELARARSQGIILNPSLHIVYLVTPPSIALNVNWGRYDELYRKVWGPDVRRVAAAVGIDEDFIMLAQQRQFRSCPPLDAQAKKLSPYAIHHRFFVANVLQDLMHELPVTSVASKYGLDRGSVQQLQTGAGTFAAMVRTFCKELNWTDVAGLIENLSDSFNLRAQGEVLPLLRVPGISLARARLLYRHGYRSIASLARADPKEVEMAFRRSEPYLRRDHENKLAIDDRRRLDARLAREYVASATAIREGPSGVAKPASFSAVTKRKAKGHSRKPTKKRQKREDGKEHPLRSCSLSSSSASSLSSHIETQAKGLPPSLVAPAESSLRGIQEEPSSLSDAPRQQEQRPPQPLDSAHRSTAATIRRDLVQQSPFRPPSAVPGQARNPLALLSSTSSALDGRSKPQSGPKWKSLERFSPLDTLQQLVQLTPNSQSSGDDGLAYMRSPESQPSPPEVLQLIGTVQECGLSITTVLVNHSFSAYDTLENVWCKQQAFAFSTVASIVFLDTRGRPTAAPTSKSGRQTKKLAKEMEMRPKKKVLEAIAVCWNAQQVFVIPVTQEEGSGMGGAQLAARRWHMLRRAMAESTAYKMAFDMLERYQLLLECGIRVQQPLQDPRLAAWVLDPSLKQGLALDGLMRLHGKQEIAGAALEGSLAHTSKEAAHTWILMSHLRGRLEHEQLYLPFRNVEMQVVPVLAEMQHWGFGFDPESCSNSMQHVASTVKALEAQAKRSAGREVSLSKNRDVAKVLYEELGLECPANLPAVKGGLPSRPSTKADALKLLQDQHEMPGIVLAYRKLVNLKTKYLVRLPTYAVWLPYLEMHRIHATQLQTAVPTGRLATTNPNLQSTPNAKTFTPMATQGALLASQDVEVSVREAFIAAPGCTLLAADYSQLEVRLMAHFSQDEVLLRVLRAGGDVFSNLAAEWLHIPPASITPQHRKQAKSACYGIMYGMGAQGLSTKQSCSVDEAREMLESFKRTYNGVASFIKSSIAQCRAKGFVTTLCGRKRYFPDINSSESSARAAAERAATNTLCQGGAADLVKTAMIRIWWRLQRDSRIPHIPATVLKSQRMGGPKGTQSDANRHSTVSSARLLLQLHDELVYEVPTGYVEILSDIVREEMEHALEVSIRLPVAIKAGKSWGSMKSI